MDKLPTPVLIPLVISAVVVYLLSTRIEKFIDRTTDHIRIGPDDKERWPKLKLAGSVIGKMESLLYLAAFVVGYEIAIGAWLAFKVAAKWDTWSHIVRLPELDKGVSVVSEEFELRHRFSSWLHSRFIIGTLSNLFVAGAGAILYFSLKHQFRWAF